MQNKLLIIDGHSLAYRCYYAVKNSPTGLMCNADGVPITITTGFLRSLSLLIKKHQPTHLATCFDPGGNTWRHNLYPEYKGNREKDPQEQEIVHIDLRNLQVVLREKAIAVCKVPNYEADDVIATICSQLQAEWLDEAIQLEEEDIDHPDLQIVISSADKDLLQLVEDELNTSVDYQQGKKSQIYTEKEVIEEFGIKPFQIPDYKALCGDKTDNIPGVTGIGKISATTLLSNKNGFHFVTAIANNLDKIKPIYAKKIEPEKDKLLLWYKLTTLESNIRQLHYCIEDFANTDIARVSKTAKELGIENGVTNRG